MALAKAEPGGKIANVKGELKNVTDFMGSMGIGFGPGGLTTTGQVSMDQFTGMLGKGLSSSGSYGGNCFDDVKDEADKNAAASGTPTSQDIAEGKSNPKDKK